MANSPTSELDRILDILERGTIVTRFYLKKRPEKRTLRLCKETRQIMWSRTSCSDNKTVDGCCNYYNIIIVYVYHASTCRCCVQYRITTVSWLLSMQNIATLEICLYNFWDLFMFPVDLKDAKEVRCGRNSKEFDRWPDELKKFEASKCFVVLYGNEFKLKTLSVLGM